MKTLLTTHTRWVEGTLMGSGVWLGGLNAPHFVPMEDHQAALPTLSCIADPAEVVLG